MSWTGGAEYDTSSQLADEVARSTGVVLAGRGWDAGASADEGGAVAGIYGGAWSGPVLVLTHHPERLASDRTVEAVSDLETALARAEELAGGRAVSILGAAFARKPRRGSHGARMVPDRGERRGVTVFGLRGLQVSAGEAVVR